MAGRNLSPFVLLYFQFCSSLPLSSRVAETCDVGTAHSGFSRSFPLCLLSHSGNFSEANHAMLPFIYFSSCMSPQLSMSYQSCVRSATYCLFEKQGQSDK
ncbi:hypothetical protein J3E68DRAFT_394994 [Trichoderma sp. SZMC 28012]